MTSKIALITGGNRGLGKDMALSLARKNIDVIITYNSHKNEADEVVSEIEKLNQKAVALNLNLSDFKSLNNFISNISEILQKNWNTDKFDFLINNAGIGKSVLINNITEEIFDEFLNIHFKSVYFLTQKALPIINNNGSIIFISSGTTRFCVNGYSVYASMKGAIEIFTKYVAHESGSRGIRANVVAPGAIETDFNNAYLRNNPQAKNFIAANTPLGRIGRADDIGSVVAFLCSEDSKWINGQRIEVSGGIS